ncbi:thiamine pyrophosphate-binding protein, partial [Candidatus Dojkabacteria bacterium]|nr:thiamine pyrophosphate-binding protein [Candidatus Dojkabacteria bacterium]
MNGSEILLNILKKHKVRYIFGYQSTTVEPFIDTINNFPEIQFIQIDNQQSAGFVAETYARASGNLGVVAIASGLEAMELASPMYNALRNSTPLVAFIGQSESTLITSKGYQQADSIGVFLPITKHTVHISNIEQFQSDVEELITVSLSSKQGPVLLEVPKDIQLQKGNYIDNFQVNPTNLKRQIVLDQKVIEEAAGMITQARKPLIFCGHGVIIAKAEHEFKELIEKTGSPVACTLHGISGFPSGHPLNFGLMGIDGHLEI